MRFASILAPVLALAVPVAARAQTWNSGSDGHDGALDYSQVASGTTVVFDPTTHDPPLDTDGDNVFHFTTITIPTGVTIRLLGNKLRNRAVFWLAQGDVEIAGTIDLSGSSGHSGTAYGAWGPSQPGPGGFPGGAGTTDRYLGTAQPGGGPGGGAVPYGGGSHADGAKPYGNGYLLPLLGGSGGGGYYAGGGGGGGAIVVASSTSIHLTGAVAARGGDGGTYYGGTAGGGAGGAIRLMAPRISGAGGLSAVGGGGSQTGGRGFIRIDSFDNQWAGAPTGSFRTSTLSPRIIMGRPGEGSGPPVVTFTRIGGVDVPVAPSASYLNPDVTVNSSQPLDIAIHASNVPVGTTVKITTYNEVMGMGSVDATLSGSLASSTATATIAAPPGFTTFYAYATWTN